MQKIWKILSVFIISTLAMPAGVFASAQNAQSTGGQAIAPAAATQMVKVVSLKAGQTVVSETRAVSKTRGCSLNAAESANLLQNARAVNLNQPASCFSLATARLNALPQLTVSLFRQFATVAVLHPNRILEYPSFAPSPITQGSALPGLVFAAFGIIIFEERKLIQKLTARLSEIISQSLILNRLVSLRC